MGQPDNSALALPPAAGLVAEVREDLLVRDVELEAARRVHRALGDTNRLAVVRRLAAGPSTVSGLIAATGLGQTLVSWHLRKLRIAGLVTTERSGRERICRLRPATIAEGHALMLVTLGLTPETAPQAWAAPALALPSAAGLVAAVKEGDRDR